MRFAALVLGIALMGIVPLPEVTPSAHAECSTTTSVTIIQSVPVITTVVVCDGEQSGGSVANPVLDQAVNDVRLLACLAQVTALGADPAVCYGTEAEAPRITPAQVFEAFRRLPLPPSKLQVQPPNGRTMVNFDTNFFTEREPFTRSVTLLGQSVQLRIFPASFTWHFDDGDPLTTSSAGAPYPDLQVTHRYLRTGAYAPRVDTTYEADWRVGGGAWQRVPGTVTIEGSAVELEAVEVRPTLVASD